MAKLTLKATPRKVVGRKVKKLRAEGVIPANVYGKKVKSAAISVDAKEFASVFKDSGETSLIELDLGKTNKSVLVRNIQHDPVDEQVLHVDFQEVDLKSKITAEIPIELTGESPAEKQGIGTVVQHLDEVEVEALPSDFPESFVIDISNLSDVDATVYVKDIKVSDKVSITQDPEEIVVKVEPLMKEEVVQAPVEGEGEAEGVEGAPEAGETSSEKPEDSSSNSEA